MGGILGYIKPNSMIMTLNTNSKIIKTINKKTSKALAAGVIGAASINCITSISNANEQPNNREPYNPSAASIIFGINKDKTTEQENKKKPPGIVNAIVGGFTSSNNNYEEQETQQPGVLDALFGSFKPKQPNGNHSYYNKGRSSHTQGTETISEKNAKKIPLMLQTDPKWASLMYGNSTIKKAGCGPTSVAMVVSALTGETVLPHEVAKWAAPNHKTGSGSSWSLFPAAGEKWGLKVVNINKKYPEQIKEHLRSGNPIIVSMSKGNFTRGGHIIVLAGIDSNDKVIVRDPNSKERSELKWDFSIIMNECSKNGDAPFFAFSK